MSSPSNLTLLATAAIVVIVLSIASSRRAGKIKEARAQQISPADRKAKDDELRRLLVSGEKIQAIKRHREFYYTGLKEAKEALEQLEEGDARQAGNDIHP